MNPAVSQAQYNQYTQRPMVPRVNQPFLTDQPPLYNIGPRIANCQSIPRASQPAMTSFDVASSSRPNVFPQPSSVIVSRATTSINVSNQIPSSSSSNINLCNSSQVRAPPQPDAPVSPPLDELRTQQQDAVANSGAAEKPSEPQERDTILKDVTKRVENMVMNQVLEEHRELKHKLGEMQKRRETLEGDINNLKRHMPGHGNLETHPGFMRKKEQLKECDSKCKEYNEAISYVASYLYRKFQHTVQDTEMRQPLQAKRNQPTRAKMSTATPTPNVVPDNRLTEGRAIFDLEDGNLWCKPCDLHFKTLQEFCDHLHKREHSNNVGPLTRPPWREFDSPPVRLDKVRTFAKLKSLCSHVGNKLKMPFKVQDIDDVLYPFSRNREQLKVLNLDRERGKIDKNDRLFSLKGFDQLVPISGFYCKLCHTTMCETKEVEEHLRTYDHNYAHAKFVALSAQNEKKFHTDLEKSLKSQDEDSQGTKDSRNDRDSHSRDSRSRDNYPKDSHPGDRYSTDRHSRDRHSGDRHSGDRHSGERHSDDLSPRRKHSTGKVRDLFLPRSNHPVITPAERAANIANDKSQYSARLPYKKPTSKIVDSHEVMGGRFVENSKPDGSKDEPKKDSESKSKPSSSSHQSNKRKVPEIVPVTKSSSGALKKLRHDNKTGESDKSESRDKEAEERRETSPVEPELAQVDLATSSDDDDELLARTRKPTEERSDEEVLVVKVVEKGDPDSPFPDLELSVSGNTHQDALKSKQLFQKPKVVLNRINLDQYKELLLPSTELWTRVNALITKKEPEDYEKEMDASMPLPQRTFVKPTGENVPVDIYESSNEDKEDFDMNRLQDFFCDA